MDAKKTAFLFIMNFQILVLLVGLGPRELRLIYKPLLVHVSTRHVYVAIWLSIHGMSSTPEEMIK